MGIGGVGSWCAEALARSGLGRLTLVDLDHVAESNINRQLPALGSTLGAAKVEVMQHRLLDISPGLEVRVVDDFVTVDNAQDLLPPDALIVDAIDQPRVKAAMIALARKRAQAIIVCGAAGARTDPLMLRRSDLALVRGDALLSSVRSRLRRDFGFSRSAGEAFGVPAVHSIETPRPGEPGCVIDASSGIEAGGGHIVDADVLGAPGAPLACGGYGSLVTVTAPMGFAAAAAALSFLTAPARSSGARVRRG